MGANVGDILFRRTIDFEYLSGKAIAIDAYNIIYQFLSIIRQRDGSPLMDRKGRVTSHLSGIFYRMARLLELNIRPVFVFDGPPPIFKERAIAAREEAKVEAERKIELARAVGIEEVKRWAQATARMTEEIKRSSERLLDGMGIPCIQAPSEGEAQAAYLAQKGSVWAVCSQDYDSLLFGAPRLVRNIGITGRRKLPGKEVYITISPELIELDKTLEQNKISRAQLIWAGIISGTDYAPGVRGVGPKKGLAAARRAKSLKDAFELVGAGKIYEENAKLYDEIFNFYSDPPVRDVEPKFKKPNKEKIISILVDEHDFLLERVEKTVDRILKEQSYGLKEWF